MHEKAISASTVHHWWWWTTCSHYLQNRLFFWFGNLWISHRHSSMHEKAISASTVHHWWWTTCCHYLHHRLFFWFGNLWISHRHSSSRKSILFLISLALLPVLDPVVVLSLTPTSQKILDSSNFLLNKTTVYSVVAKVEGIQPRTMRTSDVYAQSSNAFALIS